MEASQIKLANTSSLAGPPKPTLKEDLYKPEYFSDNDAKFLASLSRNNLEAIETAIGSLNHLIDNLKIYKRCMIDSINLQVESADIATKYGSRPVSQPYGLPGVINAPQAYDIQAIRKDNDRMESVKTMKEKCLHQKRIYHRMAEEDVKLFFQAWNRIQQSDLSFEEFIEALNGSINWNY